MIKKNIQKLFNVFGYEITKLNKKRLELELYEKLYSRESLENKCFYNIGSGSFYHPYWTNIDLDSQCYAQAHNNIEYINFDLLSLEAFPVDPETVELVYSSHVIEHITNEASQNMFNEAYRILKPEGIFRFCTPNADLLYEAYKRNDRHFYNWAIDYYSIPENYERIKLAKGINEVSFAQIFLHLIASQTSELHRNQVVHKISDGELASLFNSMKYEDVLDYCTLQCKIAIQYQNVGNHINWWNETKARKMLVKAGFKNIYRSGYRQSFSPILRNNTLFDKNHPSLSLFVESIK